MGTNSKVWLMFCYVNNTGEVYLTANMANYK